MDYVHIVQLKINNMLYPRLTNCIECASIPELLKRIDCRLAQLGNSLYNNISYMLNQPIPAGDILQLIAYKRILMYKYVNPDYVYHYSISKIASKVILLTLGCESKPTYTPTVRVTTTTTTTPCLTTTTTTTIINCISSGFWYNTIAPDESSAYYPVSMEIDESCNVYSFSTLSETDYNSYRKFDSSGTFVGETTFINETVASTPSEMKIDGDGNLYMVYNMGIRKIDIDGIILWEKYWEFDGEEIIGINFDKNGNLFVSISSNTVYLAKLSASTGTVIAQKEIDNGNTPYTNNAPLVDSLGNVLIAVAYDYDGDNYVTTIIKFTNDLSTVIWDARLDQADFGQDCDLTGFQIDANNNVYGCNYGNSIFKLNSDGTFAWARTLISNEPSFYNDNIYALAVSPEGDVFWVGDRRDCDWINDCIIDADYIVINKFNTNGVYQWSTAIGSDDDPYFNIEIGSWNYSQDAAKIRNGILMIVGVNFDEINQNEYLFKLPLTQVTPGQYGEQTFYDITSYLTSQTITSTILSSTYTVSNTTILNAPVVCTFNNITPTLNITNTIIS